ncbi:hypothetical protein HELRODRAFT_169759 [Helobdella robusta]|uniref:THAP-type domain-containing protein n=1 Tax=Helobdella robusta TaxID=6412 RepID=T1F2A9_HELRO|nr:hypothetical protein HELRODRAFT_169759 [Helobdella robusta]ESO08035.1 hypothetical protein HELRODRAFT_169759 [Helobdella robusta]
MVNKCAAYGCKSGYKSNAAIDAENKVSFHSYPVNDPELCAKWNKANPRRDFIPSRHSKMCSLHFRPSDFVDKYSDTNSTRYKNKTSNSESRIKQELKPGTIPTIFNAPSYASTIEHLPTYNKFICCVWSRR